MVTGTVSQATGGKFANGAMSGAFIHMYNAWGEKIQKSLDTQKIFGKIRSKNKSMDKLDIGVKLNIMLNKTNKAFQNQIDKVGQYTSKGLILYKMQREYNEAMNQIIIIEATTGKIDLRPFRGIGN